MKYSAGSVMVPAYRMWLVGGSTSPCGTYLTTGATSALPSRCAICSEVCWMMKLCLPSVTWGPLCSVPPVGMMTVVLPARRVQDLRARRAGERGRGREHDNQMPHVRLHGE
jgi:hypothetical protein